MDNQSSKRNEYEYRWDELCETFIPRMQELGPIQPDRYLWHVSGNVDDMGGFSIVSEGLKVRYSRCGGAICAHNRLSSIMYFYPFTVDMNAFDDSFGGMLVPSQDVLYSDFWRIDTHTYNGKWYIDPNMRNYCFVYGGRPENFICTPEDVPSYALKCFQLRMDVYLHEYKRLQEANLPVLSTSLLTPNEKVNEWIWRKCTTA